MQSSERSATEKALSRRAVKNKAKYFCVFRRGGSKIYDGSYLVGSNRVKFRSNEV
ncbi:hypothetical protein CAMRE0001_2715 [Campylobacter rectus RM3267]|uniref:Uncharacterized protein n=1 Tax=Campylobacter rectus RM3267 TaxID=553218 RepID=B9D0R9_CAMRE|nr:hypothetical protein CAMRE0001_2715 [Campylobacter rectus RM3267]